MTQCDTSPVPHYELGLQNKVFVVLGAGQGIGRQTAHALSQAGGKVVCVGRGAEMTNAVATEVSGLAVVGDASKRADMERIFAQTLQVYGRLDGVVDIIGSANHKKGVPTKNIMEHTDEDWSESFDINLRHAIYATQIGGPLLAQHGGGSIIFVGSIVGLVGNKPGPVAYAAYKAALHHFTQVAAVELGPTGVRVNAVCPGVVMTPRIRATFGDNPPHGNAYPLRRFAEPSDVAGGILFLASDLAKYITGQVLIIDGGLTLQSPPPIAKAP